MEATTDGAYPWVRAQEYQRAHPGTTICLVDDVWHAWVPKPGGDRCEGTEVARLRLDALMDRLEYFG